MSRLRNNARDHGTNTSPANAEAARRAAFFLAFGIELTEALASATESRQRIVLRLRRILERERLKGARRHWSYDLNRHIALKQALDRLVRTRGQDEDGAPKGAVSRMH